MSAKNRKYPVLNTPSFGQAGTNPGNRVPPGYRAACLTTAQYYLDTASYGVPLEPLGKRTYTPYANMTSTGTPFDTTFAITRPKESRNPPTGYKPLWAPLILRTIGDETSKRGQPPPLSMTSLRDALVFEPRETYDKGLLGTIIAGEERVALYSREKIIQALAADNDLEAHEAEEWVDYNTIGAYVGPHTPVVTE